MAIDKLKNRFVTGAWLSDVRHYFSKINEIIDWINSIGTSLGIGGSGTTNYVSKFTASGTIGNSQIFDNGTNVGIGTITPGATLDVKASGSGTIGVNINTDSTQNAKLYFRTNDSATARAQVYVEDATQKLNIYTVNNDTIFWNGNGLAQTKTLTLFTNTTAEFENNVGIGVSPTSRLHIKGVDATASNFALKVENSASLNVISVRNDLAIIYGNSSTSTRSIYENGGNRLIFGTNLEHDTANIYIKSSASNPNYFINVVNTTNNNFFSIKNDGKAAFGLVQNYALPYDSTLIVLGGGTSGDRLFSVKNNLVNSDLFSITGDGNTGVGASTLSDTRLYVKGADSTSSNFALKVDNSTPTNLFSIRNDGVIIANNLPTSAAGLPAGAIWRNGNVLNIV